MLLLSDDDSSDSDSDSDDSDDEDSNDSDVEPASPAKNMDVSASPTVEDTVSEEVASATALSSGPDEGSETVQDASAADAADASSPPAEEPAEEADDLDFFALLHHHKTNNSDTDWSFQDELTDVNPEELEETGAALWAINFALLLDDAEGSTLFRRFLKTIYCEENMRFWQDTQKLTSLPESELPAACDQLFKKYFNVNGSAINVKADTLQKVSGIMDGKEFSARTFALAEKEIFMLMKSDSYPRFINSSMYKDRLERGPAADPEMVIADTDKDSSKPAGKPADKKAKAKNKKKTKKASEVTSELTPTKSKRKIFGRNRKNKDKSSKFSPAAVAQPDPQPPATAVGDTLIAPYQLAVEPKADDPSGLTLFRFNMELGQDKQRTVVQAPRDQLVSEALARVMERFRLSADDFILLKGLEKTPINWADTVASLNGEEVRLEQRDPRVLMLSPSRNRGKIFTVI